MLPKRMSLFQRLLPNCIVGEGCLHDPGSEEESTEERGEMAMLMCRTTRLAIVGDVHDDWDPVLDARALEVLQPDVVLFTGDFGNENVNLVSDISRLNYPKAAILGNHDCWFSSGGNYNRETAAGEDRVQAQLDLLGKSHVGYSRLDFPELNLSVVGGRPGSWGGYSLGSNSIAKRKFGAKNMRHSADLIAKAALAAPEENFLLFLAHNGPNGLGSEPNDICGKDWVRGGGDHGDPDLQSALVKVKEAKRNVPLVVFGHMHKNLKYSDESRKMIVVGDDKSVYLNAAVVPRVRSGITTKDPAENAMEFDSDKSWLDEPTEFPTERNFTLVEMEAGELKKISEVWVKVEESQASLGEQTLLYPIEKSRL